jgi:phosphoribosylaminoimidazole-succinocarboxamide synthase
MTDALTETNLDIGRLRRGKVRDIYDLGEHLLIVATDRISAFDVVMPTGIPDKGRLLTALSLYWFEVFGEMVLHHLVTSDVSEYPSSCRRYASVLAGRSMLVRKAEVAPVECVVRGYLAGSGWQEYQERGSVCGVSLPAGLQEADRLHTPIFTPTTKAETGHDLALTYEETVSRVGAETADLLRGRSIALYERAADLARARGIIIADTKFEWGRLGDDLILIDEVLTPDSSRFWPADRYVPGRSQPSYDKQYLRDWLVKSGWNREPPAPALPEAVVRQTRRRYQEAYERLTGRRFQPEPEHA